MIAYDDIGGENVECSACEGEFPWSAIHVHHISGDIHDNRRENLAPLCAPCHHRLRRSDFCKAGLHDLRLPRAVIYKQGGRRNCRECTNMRARHGYTLSQLARRLEMSCELMEAA